LVHETERIEHTLHDIEQRISSNGKADVIGGQQDLINSIEMLCRKPMINFITTPISCEFPR
jgi:hypothetical protein